MAAGQAPLGRATPICPVSTQKTFITDADPMLELRRGWPRPGVPPIKVSTAPPEAAAGPTGVAVRAGTERPQRAPVSPVFHLVAGVSSRGYKGPRANTGTDSRVEQYGRHWPL